MLEFSLAFSSSRSCGTSRATCRRDISSHSPADDLRKSHTAAAVAVAHVAIARAHHRREAMDALRAQ